MSEQVILYTIIVAFLITVLLSPMFIPVLHKLKFGQSIREEGPKWHQKKSGTPTMGGIVFISSIVITTLFMGYRYDQLNVEIYLLLFVLLAYGMLGFLDDFIKIIKKRNLGLTSGQKMLGQILIALVFYGIYRVSGFPTTIAIPFIDVSLDLGWFYFLFVVSGSLVFLMRSI